MGKITIRESATDPDTPAAGSSTIFARADNSIQVRDETGAVRQMDGGAASGDVEELSTAGATNTVPTSDGAGGLAMDTPWAADITAHEDAGNPHAVYQLAAAKDQANGYAGLDGSSLVAGSQLPYGSTAATVCEGNDARLSDARAPTGAAAGDLAGAYNTGPVVAQVQGQPVSAVAPTAGQLMVFSGTTWEPLDPSSISGLAGPAGPPGHAATAFTSVQDGAWTDPLTWGQVAIYPHWGDTVEILHEVTITGNQQVGNGIKDVDPGTLVDISVNIDGANAALIMADNSSLLIDGDTRCDNDFTIGAGCTLTLSEDSELQIYAGPNDTGGLTVRGTAGNRSTITCQTQGAHFYIQGSSDGFAGNCRVDAEYCDFENFGSDTYTTWLYYHQVGRGANLPWRLSNVTCTNCTRIAFPGQRADHGASTGVVEFTDFAHIAPYTPAAPPPLWSTFETYNRPGMTFTMTRVYFEDTVALYHCDEVQLTDFIFAGGFLRSSTTGNLALSGSIGLALRGIIAFDFGTNGATRYGDTWQQCLWLHTDAAFHNVHYTNVGGDVGTALFDRCVFQSLYNQAAPGSEPDVLIQQPATSGTPATNRLLASRCLVLPNANGYNALNASGGSLIVSLSGTTNAAAEAERCTIYAGRLGGFHIGETIQAIAGTIGGMRSSLVLGYSADRGEMISLLAGGAQQDTLLAEETHHNGKFNISLSVPSAGSGTGYDAFSYSGSDQIGLNDVADQDPAFVDTTRTPLTYAGGGLAELIAQVRANWDVSSMIDYIFAGWTPTNAALQGAGDPAAGSPDIGCADF